LKLLTSITKTPKICSILTKIKRFRTRFSLPSPSVSDLNQKVYSVSNAVRIRSETLLLFSLLHTSNTRQTAKSFKLLFKKYKITISLYLQTYRGVEMNKEEVITHMAQYIKLVRLESGYTQEKMAEILGISKKTLVQIEKGRISPAWYTVVTICALFRDSEILRIQFGDDALDTLTNLARQHVEYRKERTMGGKVWWKEIQRMSSFRLQQNIISQHYRILDDDDYRWYSTFDKAEAIKELTKLCQGSE
jgi:DNA-binding XRE family transcriptional regulator